MVSKRDGKSVIINEHAWPGELFSCSEIICNSTAMLESPFLLIHFCLKFSLDDVF